MLYNSKAEIQQALEYQFPSIAITSVRPYIFSKKINGDDGFIDFFSMNQILIGNVNIRTSDNVNLRFKFDDHEFGLNSDSSVINTIFSVMFDQIDTAESDCNFTFCGYLVSYSS